MWKGLKVETWEKMKVAKFEDGEAIPIKSKTVYFDVPDRLI
jgi:hypothetical protein